MGNNDRTTGVLAEDSSDKPENKYLLYLSVIILKGKDFYKKSGFVRALILFTGVIGFLQTWYSLIKFMIFQDHTKFDYEQLFVFGRQLFWIFGFMVLIYIGTAKHKIFRQYCIDAFSFIFNAIFVLSFATSIFIVMSIPDFVISNKEGELRFSIGPASIFAILLYLANYLAVGYFNRKVITRNNLSLFAPIFILFIYSYFKADEYSSLIWRHLSVFSWNLLGSQILSILLFILIIPYVVNILKQNMVLTEK